MHFETNLRRFKTTTCCWKKTTNMHQMVAQERYWTIQ